MNLQQMAMMMLQNNPNIKNNPMAQQALQIIQSGDNAAGEQMAMNLCQTYGVSKEQAIKQAQEWAKGAFPNLN